ncbi:MAG: hypothetical protein AB1510_04070 [Bacillota bacterium]
MTYRVKHAISFGHPNPQDFLSVVVLSALLEHLISGAQKLKLFRAPAGLDVQTEPYIAGDLTFGNATGDSNNIALAGLKR